MGVPVSAACCSTQTRNSRVNIQEMLIRRGWGGEWCCLPVLSPCSTLWKLRYGRVGCEAVLITWVSWKDQTNTKAHSTVKEQICSQTLHPVYTTKCSSNATVRVVKEERETLLMIGGLIPAILVSNQGEEGPASRLKFGGKKAWTGAPMTAYPK